MANMHKREITIMLGGKQRVLTPTLEACVSLEDELERGLMDIMANLRGRTDNGVGLLKMRDIAAILRWGVWGSEGGPKPVDTEPMLAILWEERTKGRLPELAGKALAFVFAALHVDDPEHGESDGVKK